MVCTGNKAGIENYKAEMMQRFDCDDVGELKEHVGCKLDWNKGEKWLKFTQPIFLQSYQDEFELRVMEIF